MTREKQKHTISTQNDVNNSNSDPNSCCLLRALVWFTFKANLIEEGGTPPNWKDLLLIFACGVSSTCCKVFLSPFLPRMVMHFGYLEEETGTYGGMISSSLFVGTILGSLFWGSLSDKKGRRLVLITCTALSGSFAVLFGFSVNIPMAMTIRLLGGIVDGINVTCKAVLSDISVKSNQAVGMALFGLAYIIGLFVGNVLSGQLAEPCNRWPDMCSSEDHILLKFPFLLSSLVPGIVAITTSTLMFFEFKETLVKPTQRKIVVVASPENDEEDTEHLEVASLKSDKQTDYNLRTSMWSLNPDECVFVCMGQDVLDSTDTVKSLDDKETHSQTSNTPRQRTISGQQVATTDVDMTSFSSSLPKNSDALKSDGECIELHLPNLSNDCDGNCVISGDRESGQVPNVKISASEENQTVHSGNKSEMELNSNVVANNSTHPLLDHQRNAKEAEESSCGLCDKCLYFPCCKSRQNSGFFRLLRQKDMWLAACLCMELSFVTNGVETIFPVFAATGTDNGGLGLSPSDIGMALGLSTLPLLILQWKIIPFLVARFRVRKACLVMVIVSLFPGQSLPMLKVLRNSSPWLWAVMLFLLFSFEAGANSCFVTSSLLVNNSVPQELAGKANGVTFMMKAFGKALAPVVAGPIFSWSVSQGQIIGAPFDTGFAFCVLGLLYGAAVLQLLFISPRLDTPKKAT